MISGQTKLVNFLNSPMKKFLVLSPKNTENNSYSLNNIKMHNQTN